MKNDDSGLDMRTKAIDITGLFTKDVFGPQFFLRQEETKLN